MASIKTSMQLYDGMTPGIKNMNNALNIVISSFESMQKASSKTIDVGALQAAKTELNKTEIAFNQIEQEIREADAAQQQFNGDIRSGEGATDGLLGKFKALVSVGAALGIGRKLMQMSDEMTHTTARLNMMNDGLQTTAELQQMIFKSAQRSAANYFGVADSVAKLGMNAKDAFKSNRELVYFSELLNKNLLIAGASDQGRDSVMYNLTQALSAGVLRGQDLNAVLSNAPNIVQHIAEYLDEPVGKIRDLAAEGKITADVVKNAMFMAADETNEKFNSIPWTWGGVWNVVSNQILMATQPILAAISFLANHWAQLEPIVVALTAAIGTYAIILGVAAAATWIADGTAKAFFLTLLSNPLFWVALAIGALVAYIYNWVKSVGGIKIAWMIMVDKVLTLGDNLQVGLAKIFDAIQYRVGVLKVRALENIQEMVNGAIKLINGFIKAVNKIPGVSIDVISGVNFAAAAKIKNDAAVAKRQDIISQMESTAKINALQRQYNIRSAQAEGGAQGLLDGIYSGVGNIAGNTGKMADALEISEEDLKYLRDIAEREVIDRTVLRDVNVNFSNSFGDIRETADVDGIIDKMTVRLAEAIAMEAEGSFSV